MRIGTATFAIHLYRETQWTNTVTPFTKGTNEHFAATATGRQRATSLPERGLVA